MRLDTGAAPSRLAVYFFYDAEGVVDDYVVHLLDQLRACVSDILVVCNGSLTAEGRAKLLGVDGLEVMVRDNTGFDVWAYKAALDHKGWPALEQYDEVILMNFTVMGPVNPFPEMFAEMDSRDLDFWGITVHNGAPFDPWGTMPEGYIPLHLQSHFIAVRRSMLAGYEFQRYWDEMAPIRSYLDAVSKHEAIFTSHFEEKGYRWASYVDTSDMVGRLFYPLFNEPIELIENRGCPVFKRKSFFGGAAAYLDENANRTGRQLFDHLRAGDRYDDALLLPHLLRSCHQSDLTASLNLHEVLPGNRAADAPPALRTAVVARVGSLRETRAVLAGARHVPEADLLLSLDDRPGLRDAVEALLLADGRPVRLLEADAAWPMLPGVEDYEAVCAVDTTTGEPPLFPMSVEDAHTDLCVDAVLDSSGYVDNLLERFATDPYLGLVAGPPALHSRYHGHLGHEWDATFDLVDGWLTELDAQVLRDRRKAPTAPVLGSFWFRPAALAPLVAWRGLEEAAVAGDHLPSRRHLRLAQRQLFALLSQASGYLVTYGMPEAIAANQLTSLTHYVRGVNARVGAGDQETHSSLVHRLEQGPHGTGPARVGLEPGCTVTWDTADGRRDVRRVPYTSMTRPGHGLVLDLAVPAGAAALRLQLTDVPGATCRGVRLEADAPLGIAAVAAVRAGGVDLFPGTPPRYEVHGPFGDLTTLRVLADHVEIVDGDVLHVVAREINARRRSAAWYAVTALRRVGSRGRRRG